MSSNKRITTVLIVSAVLGAALLLRVINLEADPSALISRDFITDEGWWAHNARNALFYGQWRIDQYNLPLYSAYLYNALLYLAFKVFGISFTTLRILSALSGWLTVVLVFLLVRREINTRTAVFASVLLGFSNLHIEYSRTGFTESLLVFFLALTMWFWSLRRTRILFAFVAGASFGLMIATKITAAYFAPAVVLVAATAAIRRSVSRREALLWLFGLVLSTAAYLVLFILPNFSDWLWFNLHNGSGSEWSTRPSSFLESIPRLLGSAFYAEVPLITALTFLSLLLLVVGASRHGFRKAIRAAGELEITGSMLLIGYLFTLAFTQYQPERRFLPALLLMVVLSACVLGRGWASLEELLSAKNRMNAVGWFAVLFVLPAIAVLRMKWRVLGDPTAVTLWLPKIVIIAGLILISVALSRSELSRRFQRGLMISSTVIFILVFSILSLAMIYKALWVWGLDYRVSLLGLAAATGSASLVIGIRPSGRRAAVLLVVSFLLIEGIQISSWLFQPTYTLKEANATLAETLTSDDTVVTHYETVLLLSPAKVICRSTRRGFNVDVFETASPRYTMTIRRDNWIDDSSEEMSVDERPPPGLMPAKVADFALCPTRLGGPRFIVELYQLSPRMKRQRRRESD